MKVAVSGKGGSGKTTISGTLARVAARRGRRVLAIDADTNPNLGLTLGLDPKAYQEMTPLPHGLMQHERVDGEVRLSLTTPLNDILAQYAFGGPDGVEVMLVGQVRGAATGCMCSSHATVRGLLHELPSNERLVLVDAEASPEHLSRATVEAVDVQLIVAEPYFKSLETARRYSALGKNLGIPDVAIVANKVRSSEDEAAIRQFCESHGMDLFGVIPFDEALGRAERAGVAPLDFAPAGASVAAITDLLERVGERAGHAS